MHRARSVGLSDVIPFVRSCGLKLEGLQSEEFGKSNARSTIRWNHCSRLRRESDLDPLAFDAGTDSADKFASPKLLAQDDQRPIVKCTHRTKEVVLKNL